MPARTPLLVRPGARFECHGDGLCCSDVHALGPLTKVETRRISAISAVSVLTHPRLGLPVLAPDKDHTCLFFDGEIGCRIHRERGAAFKPAACRRFPFGLVATIAGVRITTAHRCPCRSMGERSPLDPEEARAAATTSGRLRIDFEAPTRVPLTRKRRVAFASYATAEAELLRRGLASLLRSNPEESPRLRSSDWTDLAHAHRAMIDGSTSGEALAWFGDALLAEFAGGRLGGRPRPFAWAFDRAERRAQTPRSGRDVFQDFAADVIWGLSWVRESSLGETVAKLEVAWRCALRLAKCFGSQGASEERAFAEAVAVIEVAWHGPFGYAAIAEDDVNARATRALER